MGPGPTRGPGPPRRPVRGAVTPRRGRGSGRARCRPWACACRCARPLRTSSSGPGAGSPGGRRRAARRRPGASRMARAPQLLDHGEVVGRGDDRHAREPGQEVHQPRRGGRVEVGGRLVEQEHLGLDGEERRQRHPLLLAARRARRAAGRAGGATSKAAAQRSTRAVDVGEPELPRAEGDLVGHGRVEEHGVDVLEEEADLAAEAAPEGRLVEPARRRAAAVVADRARRSGRRGRRGALRSVVLPQPLTPSSDHPLARLPREKETSRRTARPPTLVGETDSRSKVI